MLTGMGYDCLFDRFKYGISLKENGITILTGPNGYGKSTILRCIKALHEGDVVFFAKLDFKRIEFFFDDKESFIIEKNKDILKIDKIQLPVDLCITFSKEYIMRGNYNINKQIYLKNRIYKFSERLADDDSIVRYIDDDKINLYSDGENYIKNLDKLASSYMNMTKQMKSVLPFVYYIKEQRMLKEKKLSTEQEITDVINELPNDLKKLINEISNNYSAIANKLDRTYPNRLFSTQIGIDEKEYQMKMIEMNNKFEKLNKYNISEMTNTANVIFNKEYAKALKIYFDDFEEKYRVYEDFIYKLDLFTGIINSRLSFKEMRITRENGILITDSDNLEKKLVLSQLSSGEKQEIVLFYRLIFETERGMLLLIDEPEISLHISWQKMFMDDLLKIVNYKDLYVIVATHSPQIINNHWENQIDLGELYAEQLNKR